MGAKILKRSRTARSLVLSLSVGGVSIVVGLGLLNCSGDDAANPAVGGSGGSGSETAGGAAGEAAASAGGEGGTRHGSDSAAGGSGSEQGTTEGAASETSTGGAGTGGSGGATSSVTTTSGEVGAAGAAGAGLDGTPALTGLVVEGGRLAQLPAFAPERMRYSVIATSSLNTLHVTASAEPDVSISVSGLPAMSGEPVELRDLEPGSEFEVDVSNAEGAARSYTVLVLPQKFPEFRVTVHEPSASDAPIYLTPNSADTRHIVKLDNYGVPLFYERPPVYSHDFKKHSNGMMSYFARDEHVLLGADYEEIARVRTIGYETNQHEFRILPNGNYALLAYQRTERDLTSIGGPELGEVVDGILQEVTPAGDVLFEWNTWDHFDWGDETWDDFADYAHINSVDFDADNHWIISMRRPSQVIKIDRSTGEVVWRLGGTTSDFDFVNDPLGGLCGQHTASVLDNGNILVFDNGFNCPGLPAHNRHTRVAEYALDETAMTAELVWSFHPDGILSQATGSAQRLPNGNTFVGWGICYNHVMATEVDPAGDIVFELEAYPVDGDTPESYRALRFADD